MTEKRKPGRPPIEPGRRVLKTSVTMTREEQVMFQRLGGSKWLRAQLKKESKQ